MRQNVPLATIWYGFIALLGLANFILLIVLGKKPILFSMTVPAEKERSFYIVEAACFVGSEAIGAIIFFLCTRLIDQQTLAYDVFSSTMQFSCLDIQMVLFFISSLVFGFLFVFKQRKQPLFFVNEFVLLMTLAFLLPVNGTTLTNLAFGGSIAPEGRLILQTVASYFFQGIGLVLYFVWKGKRLLRKEISSQQ